MTVSSEQGTGPGGERGDGQREGCGPGQRAGGGAVHIGSMSGGAIATGSHGRATSHTRQGGPASADEATAALLEAVRALRADMRVLAANDDTRAVDGELDEIEGEITRTGRADRGRLDRLRERLQSGSTAVGALASAVTVAQAAAGVLG
jgi:hypothetical protein